MFKYNSQKGVSLIITFFVMAIILSVILSVSIFLYNQIKIIRNIGNSVISFFSADSGIEKVLYYDRQMMPILDWKNACPNGQGQCEEGFVCTERENGEKKCIKKAERGLCTMYLYSDYKETACPSKDDETDFDSSLLCEPDLNFSLNGPGCAPETCNDCTIAFSTEFAGKSYYVVASVKPSFDGKSTDFRIDSRGKFGNTERQIKVFMSSVVPDDIIKIENACVNPRSSPYGGQSIYISALVYVTSYTNSVGSVKATIKGADGNYYNEYGNIVAEEYKIDLDCGDENYSCIRKTLPEIWYLDWPKEGYSAPIQTYFVSIEACDTTDEPNCKNIDNVSSFCTPVYY